ncbi:MAG: low specificity L-threonine aldolase [Alphaproteobacteria bacterium]|nr:MAG: low specificity L-threonine aldolase [Alphaproteobacteria bacterium]
MLFISDTTAGVVPEILQALEKANDGMFLGYEGDPVCRDMKARFAEVFESDVSVFLVATGTAANALALSVMTPPYGVVFAHDGSHINVDECGAPEFYTQGAKLAAIKGANGKIDPTGITAALNDFPKGVVHRMQPGGVSISQATERGTIYSLEEIKAISDLAKSHGMATHMDGARFANALVALNCSPADMTWRAGVDVLSFGATKNGALMAEAVVFFNTDLVKDFAYRQKRGGHLFSKSRFSAGQFLGYFQDDLWRRLARHSNAMAAKLGARLAALPGYELDCPVDTNQIFVKMSSDRVRHWQEAGVQFYLWSGDPTEARQLVRLVCSWKTTDEQVDQLLEVAKG